VFDAECIHTPYLPPPSGSSTFRGHINGMSSPVIQPQYRDETHVAEGDLLNLNDGPDEAEREAESGVISVGGWKNGTSSKKRESRRKTGFSKGPGGKAGGRRKSVQRESSETSEETEEYGPGTGTGDEDDSDDEWEEEEWVPDVFLFEYGTVVIWGMTEKEEKAFLRSL
jgi:uncharacterized Rmd1/YagE family protein